MGGAPSTARLSGGARPQDTAEYLIGEFVGEKSFPLASDYWQKLLELPLDLRWSSHRVRHACQLLGQCIVTTTFVYAIYIRFLLIFPLLKYAVPVLFCFVICVGVNKCLELSWTRVLSYLLQSVRLMIRHHKNSFVKPKLLNLAFRKRIIFHQVYANHRTLALKMFWIMKYLINFCNSDTAVRVGLQRYKLIVAALGNGFIWVPLLLNKSSDLANNIS